MPCIKYLTVTKTSPKVLFLNLYAFSLTGGVEKVCKNFIYALSQIYAPAQWLSYSMHDRAEDVDSNYTSAANYSAFGGRKIAFLLAGVKGGLKSQTIILSHINLLLVAKLIATFKPKRRFILFAHGIEVWGALSKWKVAFIKRNVEVWAVSEYTRQRLIEKHQLAPNRVKVLNNSLSPFLIPPTEFEKPRALLQKYKIDVNQPILYTLSRLSSSEQYKGYDTVIKALSQLKSEGQKFTYLLAGKADAIEKSRIEKLIDDCDLADSVQLIGYLSEEELGAHFLLSDVFIMPSTGEGFGIVFIEAAAHGCQIIGGNADGSTDALLNGKLGQLVNPNSETEIKAAILKAINNTQHQPQQQQELVLANFGFEAYVEKVKGLLAVSNQGSGVSSQRSGLKSYK